MCFPLPSVSLPLVLALAGASAFSCGSDNDDPNNSDSDSGEDGGGNGGESAQGGDGDGDNAAPAAFCLSDKECRESGGVCDTALSTCVDCQSDTDCGQNEQCRRNQCVEIVPCDSSKDCPVDEICSEQTGFCVNCEGDNDCADGETCVYFSCLTSCDSDKDCTEEDAVCNTDESVCLDCFQSADCEDGEFCNIVGECAPRVCPEDGAFCDGTQAVSCNEDGSGFVSVDCPDVCEEGACSTSGSCETGDEGCECYPNDTCNGDLSCLSNLCVDESGGGTGGGGSVCTPGGSAPTVYILLDRSSSMFDPVDYWTDLKTGLLAAIDDVDEGLRLGFSTYTGTTVACDGLLDSGVLATSSHTSIAAHYNSLEAPEVKGETPTAQAIEETVALLELDGNSAGATIVLITDGNPDFCDDGFDNCATDATIAAIQEAHGKGFTTQVFGLGSLVNDAYLDYFAQAGQGESPNWATGLDVSEIFGAIHSLCGSSSDWQTLHAASSSAGTFFPLASYSDSESTTTATSMTDATLLAQSVGSFLQLIADCPE